MLAEHPIDVMLLATDLGVAREFYADKTGFRPEGFTPPRLREEG